MPETFIETYRKIVSEFFPGSNRYEYAGGVEIEVYPSDKTDDPNDSGEIWIAVNEKLRKRNYDTLCRDFGRILGKYSLALH